MGSWGLTNLQNDIAEDVKSDYISLLQKGKTGEEATKELTLQYEDIPQFFTPRAYKNNPNRRIQYMLSILSTSSRAVPRRNLTFIGHLKNVKRMSNEDCNSYQVSWKNFEKYIIDDFQAWSESSLTE